ncbi:restriction endonuclease subunit S [Pelobacter seleniigenes]|uniref:restriction endonuclease subunit S n=1 Tax=Pelobacter seleniigenes TaxID=407188 RepID=UPI00068E0F72|nr:restriction endonuclease subunit S [Pelobacter seleniigenes]
MTVETFFANFRHLANAPNGVQKLRELILQLAVQGKLVPQDPNAEPASVLLERIKTEKERLVKVGRIKKSKPNKPISSEDEPFGLPSNWAWDSLGNISNLIHYGYTASADHCLKDVRLLRITDIQNNKVNWDSVPGCQIDPKFVAAYELNDGDLLIARTGGTIGKTYLVENVDVCSVFASYLIRVVPNQYSSPRYLKVFAESPLYWEQLVAMSMGTGQPNVNGTSLGQLKLPLPPLEEQKRIVAKVDQLMALCDELEARQQKQQQGRVRLNNAALDALLTAREPDEFADHWQRISTNFDLLYDHPETITKLRAAILQLAVQGKLVPQVPNDEPALVLLERIKARKDQLAKEKVIKKEKPLPQITPDVFLHSVPSSWGWAHFQDVTLLVTDGEHSTPPRVPSGVPMATAKNIRDGHIDLRATDFVSEETAEKCWKRCHPRHDDILMVCVGATTGRLSVIKEPKNFVLVRSVALIRPFTPDVLPEYLAIVLRSPVGQRQIWGNVKQSAQPCLYIGKIKEIEVPVPPKQEQKRIVAKVEQLMDLCDELEVKLNQAQKHSAKLMEATVRQLLVV